MVPVEQFGRGLHVKPGIKPVFLTSIESSIGHGGKATFSAKRMRHFKFQIAFNIMVHVDSFFSKIRNFWAWADKLG